MSIEKLGRYLVAVEDPRCSRKTEHRLTEVLVIAVCAVDRLRRELGRHRPVWPQQARVAQDIYGAGELAETQSVRGWGLEPSVLRRWRSLANGRGRALSAARPGTTAALSAGQVEIRRLPKELERAQMERDILKKAVGIFSGPPR